MLLNTGTVLQNRYRIDSLLRREDMGAVYRATDLRTSAPVVVTEHHILSVRLPSGGDDQEDADESLSSLSSSEEVRDRFEKEAQALVDLDHPGVPKVRDYFDVPGHGQYLVISYVEGRDLKEMLDSGDRPAAGRLLEIGVELCAILDYLHGRTPPVIHRDIKPANIRITPEGRAVLVGFGVGREQSPGEMTLGAPSISPGYSPLEQYGGDDITDHRSDIYSLGATLLALATGQAPPAATERALRNIAELPGTDELGRRSPALLGVLSRATALLPKDRYQNVRDFRAALDALLPRPVEAAKPEVLEAAKPDAPALKPEVAAAPPEIAKLLPAASAKTAPPPEKAAKPAATPTPKKATKPAPATPAPEKVARPAPSAPVPEKVARPASQVPERRRPAFGWFAYPVGILGLVFIVIAVMNVVRSNREIVAETAALDTTAATGNQSAAAGEPAAPPDQSTSAAPPAASDVSPEAPAGTTPPVSPPTETMASAGTSPPVSSPAEAAPAPETGKPAVAPAETAPPTSEAAVASIAGAAPTPALKPARAGHHDKTGLAAPASTIRILPISNPGSSSIDLEWTPSDQADFAAYEIYYAQRTDDFVVPLFIRSGKPIRNRHTTKASVGNLRCGTSYAIKVRAVSADGSYRDSEAANMITGRCAIPDTILVSTRGDAPYASLDDALKAATTGSRNLKRILLRPGYYVLNGAVTLDRPLTITGIGPRANVVIEAGGDPGFVINTRAAFRGVTIRSARGRGVVVNSEAIFEDCDFSATATPVEVGPVAVATLRQCRIHDSRATGVQIDNGGEGRIDDCEITGNAAGIVVQEKARLALSSSQVLRSREGHGITVRKFGMATLVGCDISGSRKSGLSLDGGAAEVRDCRINKNRWYGIDCSADGLVNVKGCSYAGNRPDNVDPFCGRMRGSLAAH